MPLYNVHIYREMKLRFDNIEADSPEQAAKIAKLMGKENADSLDECDGVDLAALVDVVGDEEFEQSKFINFPVKLMQKGCVFNDDTKD